MHRPGYWIVRFISMNGFIIGTGIIMVMGIAIMISCVLIVWNIIWGFG